jgi:hypothetical protein
MGAEKHMRAGICQGGAQPSFDTNGTSGMPDTARWFPNGLTLRIKRLPAEGQDFRNLTF